MKFLLAALLLLASPLAASAQDGMCKESDNRSWVQGDGECLHIRTFARDVKSPNPVLMVFLHGDRSSGAPLSWEMNYAQQFMSADVAAVTLVRPGYPTEGGARSTGAQTREDHYTERNIRAVAGALKRLKEHHKARRLVILGYSGGAATTGVLLGKHPGIADAAVLLACPCDIPSWRNSGNRRAWPRSLSPHDFTSSVPPAARVLAMTGSRDTNTDERLARNYVERLKTRSIRAEYRTIAGVDHDSIAANPDAIAAIKDFLATD